MVTIMTTNGNNNDDKVKIKILAPLADKKDTEKLVISTMVNGQIQSESNKICPSRT